MADLIELAERCERAPPVMTGALIEAAWMLIHGTPGSHVYPADWTVEKIDLWRDFEHMLEARAHLSAAMTLVPEGAEWLRKSPEAMTVYFHPKNDKVWATHHSSGGSTPALALCAAALRARAA